MSELIPISIMVDAKTYLRLEAIAAEKFGACELDENLSDSEFVARFSRRRRRVAELAEAAVSEEALSYFRDRGMQGDPA